MNITEPNVESLARSLAVTRVHDLDTETIGGRPETKGNGDVATAVYGGGNTITNEIVTHTNHTGNHVLCSLRTGSGVHIIRGETATHKLDAETNHKLVITHPLGTVLVTGFRKNGGKRGDAMTIPKDG